VVRDETPSAASPDFRGIVVAAGRSTRFGSSVPKPFQILAGRMVLHRSVACLADRSEVNGVVVVLTASEADETRGRAIRAWPGVADVVAGGETRADSVSSGLAAVGNASHVLVHDAARPLASPALVDAVIDATRRHGAAVPVLRISDTVKELDDGRITGTRDRERLRLAQTPQGSRVDWLRSALGGARSKGFEPTDESAALERAGHRVAAVPGDADNLKITTPGDLIDAERRIGGGSTGIRVGTGFDIHRVDSSRPLVLGGITFEGEPGLAGHSDADVVLHAAMDALLGAAALGDIGVHFPPDDPAYAGADSTKLARRVAELLEGHGYSIINLDLMLLAEAPRIRDQVEPMRATIAECLGTDPSRVGLKATTLEGLGSLGRGEGTACQAVALIGRRSP
jgi:2-C-methyl-D-erythritol 4-phosphate cytidylyltransferase/2-C-methyl-D-erythritol 2,4-cyclodiphosphate synthase